MLYSKKSNFIYSYIFKRLFEHIRPKAMESKADEAKSWFLSNLPTFRALPIVIDCLFREETHDVDEQWPQGDTQHNNAR